MWYIYFILSKQNPDSIHIGGSENPIESLNNYRQHMSGDSKADGYFLYVYPKETMHSMITSKKHIENLLKEVGAYSACDTHDYRKREIYSQVLNACQRIC